MSEHVQILEPGLVRLERVLPGPIERLWRYITESDKRKQWLAAGAFDLRVGGATSLHFAHKNLSSEQEAPERYKHADNAGFTGTVIACDPPRLLTITWGSGPDASEVTFELAPQDDRVKLVLTHRRLPARELTSVAAGWHTHVGILEDRLDERTPRGFWSTHGALEQDYKMRLQVMDDYFRWSADTERELRDNAGNWSSCLRRVLDAPIDRVWAAWTDAEKIPLWFGRPTGTFAVGGTIHLDLSQPQPTIAKILGCEPPRRLRTTWQYGDWPPSEVELRLTATGARTLLELEHFNNNNNNSNSNSATPDDARGTGSGWEVALLHLDHHLRGRDRPGDVMFAAMDHAWTRVPA